MQGRFSRVFITAVALASAVVLTGCPELPEGETLGLHGKIEESGNIYDGGNGFKYTPIGGTSRWELTDTSCWQFVVNPTMPQQHFYANDTIPTSTVEWSVGSWSKTPGAKTGVLSITEIANDMECGPPPSTWNMRCTFQNRGNPPFRLQAPYPHAYCYVNVIAPSGVSHKCSRQVPFIGGDEYLVVLEIDDRSGSPSKLSWSHCEVKEFPREETLEDGCKATLDGIGWGSSGNPDINIYGDTLRFRADESANPDISTPGYHCETSFKTDWKIRSNGGPWYDLESVTYRYIFYNNNGVHQLDLLRNGQSANEMPSCSSRFPPTQGC